MTGGQDWAAECIDSTERRMRACVAVETMLMVMERLPEDRRRQVIDLVEGCVDEDGRLIEPAREAWLNIQCMDCPKRTERCDQTCSEAMYARAVHEDDGDAGL